MAKDFRLLKLNEELGLNIDEIASACPESFRELDSMFLSVSSPPWTGMCGKRCARKMRILIRPLLRKYKYPLDDKKRPSPWF
jgi:hypothetical protein